MCIWLTISSCYGSIPMALELIGKDGGLSTLCHSCRFALAEDAKNVSWPWLSPLRGWGSLTVAFTGKFEYILATNEDKGQNNENAEQRLKLK